MAQVFSCEFWEISKSTFFTSTASEIRSTLGSSSSSLWLSVKEYILACHLCKITVFFIGVFH